MSQRALVTGANGFVGQWLCRTLREAGWEAVPSVAAAHPAWPGAIPCDIRSSEAVDGLLREAGPVDCVFHLAAVSFAPRAGNDPAAAFDVNLQGTVRVAEAMIARQPGARLVFIGSGAAYGPPHFLPITEDHPLDPGDPYAISKCAADQYCAFLHEQRALDVVRLRPFNHTGPGQSPAFALSSFARQIALIELGRQEPVIHVGNLDVARDFTHVADVARAYVLAASKADSGQAYNICSGQAQSLREAVERLQDMARVPVRIDCDPERMRAVDVREVVGSYAKFAEKTRWSPVIPFEQLLADLLDYWRAAEA